MSEFPEIPKEFLKTIEAGDLPYLIKEELGTGYSGAVFLAKDMTADRHVAIKMIAYDNEKIYNEFMKETDILLKISRQGCHTFIPCLYDRFIYVDTENTKFLTVAMKYIKGEDFGTYIDINMGTMIPTELTVNFMWWLFKAICFLHEHGIVHRDIKPDNIILEESTQQLVLVDFGFSCDIKAKAPMITRCEGMKGTPRYVAPEIWKRNLSDKALKAADVWAAGIIFYEIVDEEWGVPFGYGDEQDIQQFASLVVNDKRNPLITKNITFKNMIDQLLTNNYEERPTACEVYKTLDRLKNTV